MGRNKLNCSIYRRARDTFLVTKKKSAIKDITSVDVYLQVMGFVLVTSSPLILNTVCTVIPGLHWCLMRFEQMTFNT